MHGDKSLIFATWMGVFIYGYLNAMLGIVLPNLMEKLKLDKSRAGLFFMMNSVGLIVASVPSGLAMDAVGPKLIVCLGLFLVAASFWLMGSIASAKPLYVLAFFLGLGGAMVIAGENTVMSMANASHREVAANLLNLFFGVGAFLAPFLVMPVLKRQGFSGVLRVSSFLTLAILLLHLLLAFPTPGAHLKTPFDSVGALLAQPRLLLLMLLVFLYVGTEFSIWNWTVTLFTTERGFSQLSASRLISAFALTMIAGRWASQWTLAAFGSLRVLLLSAAGAALCLAAMYTVRRRSVVILASLGGGWCMAAIFPTAMGLAGVYFPSSVGTAISFVTTGGWLGAIVIPPAIGFVAARRGVGQGMLIPVGSALLMVCAVLLLMHAG